MKNKIKNSSEIHVIVAVDPGERISGLSIIMLSTDSGQSPKLIGSNEENSVILDEIKKYYVKYETIVLIEDIVGFRQRMSKQVIQTCKFIGELNYRLNKELRCEIEYKTRGRVKKWIFDTFPALSGERITKKIAYLDDYGEKNDGRRYRNKDGSIRKPSFHWVDDRVVISAMKGYWNIPTPKPGKRNIYGFSQHSWQALALATYWMDSNKNRLRVLS